MNQIREGMILIDGDVDPHDILKVKGQVALAEYLLNEIQEVYRLRGVKINDKHIEVIVRRMLRKVKIIDPGDSHFLLDKMLNDLNMKPKTFVFVMRIVRLKKRIASVLQQEKSCFLYFVKSKQNMCS